jgi:transcriptional regulator with XRE-family HTH domain
MKYDWTSGDHAILKELGSRIARYRLNRNLTQEALAEQAGVSRPTIARLEQGSSTNLSNLVRVLRALRLVQNLEALVPEPPSSPIQQLRTKKKQRLRASSKTSSVARPTPWMWGDET